MIDALLLRAMREENAVGTFDQEMASLCKMHKNRQITVEFIARIPFEQGMDARQMKKRIQLAALENFQQIIDGSDYYQLSLIFDIEESKITDAVIDRFDRVITRMINNAESKL